MRKMTGGLRGDGQVICAALARLVRALIAWWEEGGRELGGVSVWRGGHLSLSQFDR